MGEDVPAFVELESGGLRARGRGAAASTSKSAVARRFVAATETALAELMSRRLDDLDLVALMIDGVPSASHLRRGVSPRSTDEPAPTTGCRKSPSVAGLRSCLAHDRQVTASPQPGASVCGRCAGRAEPADQGARAVPRDRRSRQAPGRSGEGGTVLQPKSSAAT